MNGSLTNQFPCAMFKLSEAKCNLNFFNTSAMLNLWNIDFFSLFLRNVPAKQMRKLKLSLGYNLILIRFSRFRVANFYKFIVFWHTQWFYQNSGSISFIYLTTLDFLLKKMLISNPHISREKVNHTNPKYSKSRRQIKNIFIYVFIICKPISWFWRDLTLSLVIFITLTNCSV